MTANVLAARYNTAKGDLTSPNQDLISATMSRVHESEAISDQNDLITSVVCLLAL